MLSKKLKLSIKEFPKGGNFCFRGDKLSIKKAPNKYDYSRLGVVISKKTSPKATVRNWIKRVIYDFFREHLEKVPEGIDLLVVIGGHIIEANSDIKDALNAELEKGFKALK